MFEFLDECEEKLGTQLTELETKIETLKGSSKKGGKKGASTSSAASDSALEELQSRYDRHRYHIDTFQTIKDRLEHDELEVTLVEDIKDGIEYYVNSNAEPEFEEDETLYDELELDKQTERDEEEEGGEKEEEDEEGGEGDEDDAAADEDNGEEEDAADESDTAASAGTVSAILKTAGAKSTPVKSKQLVVASPAAKQQQAATKTTAAGPTPVIPASSPLAPSPLTAAALVKAKTAASTPAAAATTASTAGPTPVMPASSPSAGKTDTLASIIAKNQKQTTASPASSPAAAATTAATTTPTMAATVAAGKASSVAKTTVPVITAPTAAATSATPSAAAAPLSSTAAAPAAKATSPPMPTAASIVNRIAAGASAGSTTAAGSVAAPKLSGFLPTGLPSTHSQQPPMMPPPGLSSQSQSQSVPPGLGLGTGVGGMSTASTAELSGLAPSSTLTGVSGGGSGFQKDRTFVSDDYLSNLTLLESSLRHFPDSFDSERPKEYVPRNPYRTPPYFPSVPAPIFDDPLLFDKLSVDTLFFIFYFQQGTPHQYLAARELKKQSWRYHKVSRKEKKRRDREGEGEGEKKERREIYTWRAETIPLCLILSSPVAIALYYSVFLSLSVSPLILFPQNFLTWFQRHDDPKITTDEFEQGTYVYFDYESGWVTRIKADFTFEYRHLETDLPDPVNTHTTNARNTNMPIELASHYSAVDNTQRS